MLEQGLFSAVQEKSACCNARICSVGKSPQHGFIFSFPAKVLAALVFLQRLQESPVLGNSGSGGSESFGEATAKPGLLGVEVPVGRGTETAPLCFGCGLHRMKVMIR